MTVDRSRLPPVGPSPRFRLPVIERHELVHGATLLTAEHRGAGVLSLVLQLPLGAANDPPGGSGLAGLTADLLDEGSRTRPGVALHEALAAIGAHLETEVSADATTIRLVTLARFLDDALDLLAEIVTEPRFDDADVERVRSLRLSRLRQLRSVPSATADRLLLRQLYGSHPYALPALGTEEHLAGLTSDDVRAFHGNGYPLGGATIIAIGDASHAELLSSVERAFGPRSQARSAGPTDPAPIAELPPAPARRLALAERARAAQSEIRVGRVTVTRRTPDYHALLVLNTVLGGQFVSRINMNLREEKGYTYGARSTFDLRRRPGPFLVQTSVQTDATADAVSEVLNELRDIGNGRPVTAEELARAKDSLTRGYPRSFETGMQLAMAVAHLTLHDLPPAALEELVPAVERVDAPTLSRLAQRYLDPDDMQVVVVGDPAGVVGPLEALGLGPPVSMPV